MPNPIEIVGIDKWIRRRPGARRVFEFPEVPEDQQVTPLNVRLTNLLWWRLERISAVAKDKFGLSWSRNSVIAAFLEEMTNQYEKDHPAVKDVPLNPTKEKSPKKARKKKPTK